MINYIEKNEYKRSETKLISWWKIVLASVIAGMNILFLDNYIVSSLLIIFELGILISFFIKKDITNYLGCYLVFLCLSFEFGAFVGNNHFYGFKEFRILGINLGVFALLPIVGLLIIRGPKIKKVKKEFKYVFKICFAIICMNITGVVFGLFQILVNDNNINNMNGVLSDFIGISYNMILIPLLIIITIFYIISWEKEKVIILEEYLVSVLIGVVISMIISLVSGNFGRYGGVDTLLVTNLLIYSPFLLIFTSYEQYKSKKIVLVIGMVGASLALLYNASGKIIILYILMPILIIYMAIKRKRNIFVVIMLLLLPLIIIIAIQFINVLIGESILFESKFREAWALVAFWEPDWIINMPLSPRTRIAEFMNTIYEYLNKPWFLLLGKGYMGSFTDHTGILSSAYIQGAYSINQWMNGTFYAVHETLNVLFLYNGLFGVFIHLSMIKLIIKNIKNNPWILIGGFWFIVFYGYSVTISAFGCTALLYGCILLEKTGEKNEN